MGYRLAPGGEWNNEYLIADLTDFIGKDLSIDADHGDYSDFFPHITKVVYVPKGDFTFPLKAKYEHINTTIDGMEKAAARRDWWSDEVNQKADTGVAPDVSSPSVNPSDFDNGQ